MFYPGETIAHTFTLPYKKSEIDKVIISYRQNGHIVLEKIITSATNMEAIPSEEKVVFGDTTIVSQEEWLAENPEVVAWLEEHEAELLHEDVYDEGLEETVTRYYAMETVENETRVSSILSENESLLFHDSSSFGIQVNVLLGDGLGVSSGRVTSHEIEGRTGLQHIREIGPVAGKEGSETLYIDDDGYLVHEYTVGGSGFAIDSDGYLVIERKGV